MSKSKGALDEQQDEKEYEEDDLYQDLDDKIKMISNKRMKPEKISDKETKISEESQKVVKKMYYDLFVEQLQQKLERLEKENDILKRNIGILYRTARVELKRKSDIIARFDKN